MNGGEEEGRGGISGDRRRLGLGCTIYRWSIIEWHTWNLYNFINQCLHPNQFNKYLKKKKRIIPQEEFVLWKSNSWKGKWNATIFHKVPPSFMVLSEEHAREWGKECRMGQSAFPPGPLVAGYFAKGNPTLCFPVMMVAEKGWLPLRRVRDKGPNEAINAHQNCFHHF